MRRAVFILLLASPVLFSAVDPGLTSLGQAINAYNAHDYSGAVQRLRNRSVPGLEDYAVYYYAASLQLTGDFDRALEGLDAYRTKPVKSSPLAGKIAVLHARVLLDKHEPGLAARATRILHEDYAILPQPEGDFALALAAEASGDNREAALRYQRVYYSYPNSDLAAQAAPILARIRESMAGDYPEPTAAEQLERCRNWIAAKQYRKARAEYFALAESLTGPDRDDARVGVGIADYLDGKQSVALHYLEEFHVDSPDTEARRLYYVTEAARRVVDDNAMNAAVETLNKNFPRSVWRMKALMSAGNRYAFVNDRADYTPLYKAACEDFPDDPATAEAHWRLTWDAYTAVRADRVALLREQISRYPADGHASTALYYLGRIAEEDDKPAEARAWYAALSARFPHYFYTTLARERKQADSTAPPDKAIEAWLETIAWPRHRNLSETEPNIATRRRIERTRLLVEAGQPDLAEAEARFGARTGDEQPQLLALDLARTEPTPFKALRLMKSLTADYLALPTADASPRFWEMLFPMPWRDSIVRDADAHDLDPYNLAGLIRQESEFNPKARSHANAYGLMQLMPSTGRMLGRQQGIAVTRPIQLFNPALNIQLGARYLRAQLDTWGGDWYRTLAAYNAGPTRVREWTSGASFREPVEFVESIPFDETREYVQAVLRNADMYRELYSGKPQPPPSPAPVTKKAGPVASARKKPAPHTKRPPE